MRLGLLAAFLMTSARRLLVSRYFAGGVAVALLIFLPNFLWQVHHGFISYHFLHSIHIRDVGEGRAKGFLPEQFLICTNGFAAALWIAGLVSYLRSKRYIALAWMYLVPLALFYFGKGRGYYLAAAYPMLIAMGAVIGERWVAGLRRVWGNVVRGVFFTGLVAYGLYACAILIPFASGGPLMRFALGQNGDLREEIGWTDLVKTVVSIRDSLPSEQQASMGIVVGNYGEQGAIEILGPKLHLPGPISGTNSAWLRGYPAPQPQTLIVIGLSRGYVERTFTACRLAGHNGNSLNMENEESKNHPDIFVCGGPKVPWTQFWMDFQDFG